LGRPQFGKAATKLVKSQLSKVVTKYCSIFFGGNYNLNLEEFGIEAIEESKNRHV
jgi:hypothetical protein